MSSLVNISSVINVGFLQRLSGGEVKTLTTGTSAELKTQSTQAVNATITGVSQGTRIFSNAIQSLNGLVNFVNITRNDVNQLKSITTDMIDVVQKATKSGIGQSSRTSFDTQFQELATKFKQVLSSASNRTYDGMKKDDLISVFEKLGFDSHDSKTFIDLLSEFDYKTNTDNKEVLVTDTSQARRPIRVPQSAYDVPINTVYNNGDGTFYQTATRSTGTAAANYVDVKSGDFNGDSISDLAFLSDTGFISTALGNGDGSFKQLTTYSLVGSPGVVTNISITDINGDGRSDISATANNTGKLFSTLANADGSFAASVTTIITSGFSLPSATFSSSASVIVDGDTNVDQLSANNNLVYFNHGNGNGTYTGAASVTVLSANATSFTTLDYNNDGNTDFAVTTSTGLSIYGGNGAGDFTLAQTRAFANTTSSNLLATDLDGDGFTDLVSADSATGKLLVWKNASGTYSAPTSIAAVGNITSLQSGDINNDGTKDIVAVSGLNKKILTYFGTGGATFAAAMTSSVGSTPQSALLKDFDSDGLQELITADSAVSNVDNVTFQESTQSIVSSTGRKGSTKDYGSLFAAGRTIRNRPDAFKMLADLKALDKQLDTNKAGLQDAFNFVVDNMQMLRGVGLAFIDATKELIQKKPSNADAIAAIVEEKVRNGGLKVAKQIGNLNNLSALAATRLSNASKGQA